jgi:hypothetical protein
MNFPMIAKPITLCSVLILVGMGHVGYGQQKKEGSIQTDDIILEKERKIELKPEISRNFEPLDEIENLNKGRKMKYEFLERKWDAKNTAVLSTSVIGPREGDELVSSFGQKYKNMIKLGAGNYGHTLVNGHFGFAKENQFQGIYINHDANRRGPIGGVYGARNENEVKLYSKTFTGNYLLDGSIGYKRTEANYYGRDEDKFETQLNKMGIVYNKFNYIGSIGNAKKDAKYDYIASSGLTYLSTSNSNREWIWESKINSVMHVNDQISAYLNGDMLLSEITNSQNNRRELYRIKPSFLYKNGRTSITAGINIANEKDKLANLNQTRIFPMLKLDVKPTEFLHVFVGIGGDTYFNSMNQFVSENYWLGNDVNLKNTVQSTHVYGGIKGSNERNFDFEMKFGYSEYSNLSFFTSVQGDSSRYNVSYAGGDKKVQVVNISGQINYQILNEVLSILKYDYNSYENLGELEKPYHRPAINLSFTNSITFKDRIIISPDVFYLGGLYGFNPSQQKSVKMPDIVDLNFKVNYLITKKFNASVSANNILGKMNQRYLFYPQQSLNYTVGIAYSF